MNIIEQAAEVLFLKKSKQIYIKQYAEFKKFCTNRSLTENYSEKVLFTYFLDKSLRPGSSKLWSLYSMLKATFIANEGVTIVEKM